jgi:hypothetical protein
MLPDEAKEKFGNVNPRCERLVPWDLGELVLGILRHFQFVSVRVSEARKLISVEFDVLGRRIPFQFDSPPDTTTQ